jgi:hypothetical protein
MTNVLRVEYDGENAGHVNLENGFTVPPVGSSIGYRMYLRNGIPNSVGTLSMSSNHPVSGDYLLSCNGDWQWQIGANADGTFPFMTTTWNSGAPNRWWTLNRNLQKDRTYLVEWLWNRTATDRYTMRIRIDGVDETANFVNGDVPGTMASMNPSLILREECLRNIQLGNNGPGWTVGPAHYIYYGGIAVCNGWCGPFT